MKKLINFCCAIGTACILTNAATAQMQAPSSSGGGSAAVDALGVQEQGVNATDTFAGLTFKADRIVRDPSQTNSFRLILRVTETEKVGRRLAMIHPTGTLIDDIGNVYYIARSSGVPMCTHRSNLLDLGSCLNYARDTPVIMTPSQATPVVLTLVPYEDAFSAELAAIAGAATLSVRFGIFGANNENNAFHDVVINGIELPQGGS